MARSTTATGISELIEQARVFAHGPRPDRSIVFLAVTAEEKGLLGSEYYATHPLYPLGKTVADLNIDAWQSGRPAEELHHLAAPPSSTCSTTLIAEGKRQGRYFTPDPHPETGGISTAPTTSPSPRRRSRDQLLARATTW